MVEFGGNNPGKNESPEEFNHRTSVQISVLFHKNVRQTESWKKDGSHEEFNHRIVFKYSINVLHDACKVVDLFAMWTENKLLYFWTCGFDVSCPMNRMSQPEQGIKKYSHWLSKCRDRDFEDFWGWCGQVDTLEMFLGKQNRGKHNLQTNKQCLRLKPRDCRNYKCCALKYINILNI